jgi:hypothetical protein
MKNLSPIVFFVYNRAWHTLDTVSKEIRQMLDFTKSKIYFKSTIVNGGVAQSVRAQDS